MSRSRLFFIMPFGVRQAGEPPGEHDFDDFYHRLLRPLAIREGWEPLRIDEVVTPGLVTTQALQEILTADLVVADVSSPNGNVYYELGVRQAIAPTGTVLVAVSGTVLPFDIANQRVLFYQKDFENDTAFAHAFADALREWDGGATQSSPVRSALEQLALVAQGPQVDPANFERELNLKIGRAQNHEQLIAVWHWAQKFSPLPTSGLLALAEGFADANDYTQALEVMTLASTSNPDYEILRMRGFYLRHLDDLESAAEEFQRALELNPNDPETLGMLGGVYKRTGNYSQALNCYRRGVALSPRNLYMLVNEAALAILESPGNPQGGVGLYEALLEFVSLDPRLTEDSWASLVRAEAMFAIGDESGFRKELAEAQRQGARPQDVRSVADQLALLGSAGYQSEMAARLEGVARGIAEDQRSGTQAKPALEKAYGLSEARRLVVHLSDPHFGSIMRDGRAIEMHRFFDGENSVRLSAELVVEIRRAANAGNYKPEDISIVVSGDLTYQATVAEFKLVEAFLQELCQELSLQRQQIILVPGNHDVDWRLAAIDVTHRFDNYLTFVRRFYGKELFEKLFPLIAWDFDIATDRPPANNIVLFSVHGPLAFVGLNSCVFETDQDHYGFVGLRQLDLASGLLEQAPREAIKIAVMHHHLHPFPEVLEAREGSDVWLDLSTVRDAGIVEQRLEQLGIDVVLHGHKHKPQLRETLVRHRMDTQGSTERKLVVSGAGSVGVNSRELEHSESNHFALVEVLRSRREADAEFLRVEWREMSYLPGANWATQQRWVING
ncbi:tetratricopeptide repeat protein [Nocardioides astragali]|uniref:Tetratricopeptide repeat protein n=1 Tax=Nocardioides astragali TaxID=1776736 RepID=A0ABW2MVC6_9ACTN|nr:tetratricopeptide repeat protein [Nocardioides astragali]